MTSKAALSLALLAALAGWAGCAPGGSGNGDSNMNANDNVPGNDNEPGNDNAPANDNENGSGAWQEVLDVPDAALLAVSGTSPTDVYVVGSDDGTGSMFLHYDGTEWTRLESGTTSNLWWISAAPVDGLFFLCGDLGQIVRFDPETGVVDPPMTTPSDSLRVFGTWGATADDVWAAISDTSNSTTGGQIWHYDGNANDEWVNVDLSNLNDGAGIPGLIKVWGRSANEIYAVGAQGTALAYDGTTWSEIDPGTTRTLFSVHGNSELVGACGGAVDGVITELSGGTFTAVPIITQMNGIFFDPNSDFAVAIGVSEQIAFRENGTWTIQTDTGLTRFELNFHGPWIDSEGGVWATGGALDTQPMVSGVLVYFGPQDLPTDSF